MKTSRSKEKSLRRKTVVLILTGSIAAVRAPDLIRGLREAGARVLCVMTEAARHFVTPVVIRSFSEGPVYGDWFGQETPQNIAHISLAEDSDLVLAAPASADFIARLAAGMADDLASCIVLATRRPVVIAPAMNDQMYRHPLTQKNIRALKEIGYHFVDPIEGELACGRHAVGHIAETADILRTVRQLA